MSLKKSVLSVATAATLAAGTLASVSTSASAHGWRHYDNGPRYEYAPRANHWAGEERHGYRNNGYRDYDNDGGHEYRHRNHEGRALAIGAFAAILGIALASQDSHVQHDYYDEN